MLERFTHTYRIGVAADGLAVLEVTRGLRARSRLLAEARIDAAEGGVAVGNGLRRLLADLPLAGRAATVVLADELARIWQVAPPRGASRMADLEAAAALRFQALFGAPAAGWKISAGWDADRPFLAAAVPAPMLATLQELAAEQRLHLVEIAPGFIAALNGWRKLRRPGAWFGQVDGAVLTLAVFEAGAPVAVRSVLAPAGADRAWFEAHIAREALLLGVAQPALVQLCGAGEGHAARAWTRPGGTGPACMLLGGGASGLSGAARLAATGSAA